MKIRRKTFTLKENAELSRDQNIIHDMMSCFQAKHWHFLKSRCIYLTSNTEWDIKACFQWTYLTLNLTFNLFSDIALEDSYHKSETQMKNICQCKVDFLKTNFITSHSFAYQLNLHCSKRWLDIENKTHYCGSDFSFHSYFFQKIVTLDLY